MLNRWGEGGVWGGELQGSQGKQTECAKSVLLVQKRVSQGCLDTGVTTGLGPLIPGGLRAPIMPASFQISGRRALQGNGWLFFLENAVGAFSLQGLQTVG